MTAAVHLLRLRETFPERHFPDMPNMPDMPVSFTGEPIPSQPPDPWIGSNTEVYYSVQKTRSLSTP